MRYIPPEERLKRYGMQKGMLETIETALEVKFGAEGVQMMPALYQLYDLDKLNTIHRAAITNTSLEELRALIPSDPPEQDPTE